MEQTQFFAVDRIGAAEKTRLLVYADPQGRRISHAPLSALMAAGFQRDQGANWRQYADGTCVQWGTSSGIDPLVSFARPFDVRCWHVSLNVEQGSSADRLVTCSSLDVTRFSFTAQGRFVNFQGGGGVADAVFHWMAWGE